MKAQSMGSIHVNSTRARVLQLKSWILINILVKKKRKKKRKPPQKNVMVVYFYFGVLQRGQSDIFLLRF